MGKHDTERLVASRLLKNLHNRSLSELRLQWSNLVSALIKWDGRTPPRHLIEFESALLEEWKRRTEFAVQPKNYFVWPSSIAWKGDGKLDGRQWHLEGVLSFLGYRVGETAGLTIPARHIILNAVQTGALPPINDSTYMAEWGEPSSSKRLCKLANEIAAFARNAKRRRAVNLELAISDWESDLRHLYVKFYVDRFGFCWVETK